MENLIDIKFIIEKLPNLLKALPVTMEIMILTLFWGCTIGLLMAVLKISGSSFVKKLLTVITACVRGIPTILILFLIYFGLPVILKNFSINAGEWDKKIFVVAALSIEFGIQSSELFKSAYNGIDKGQINAAISLGYSTIQRFFYLYIPQGLKIILPNLGNCVLACIQSTALVYTLGVFDLLGKARQIDSNAFSLKTFEMYLTVSIIYWIMALINDCIFKWVENRNVFRF